MRRKLGLFVASNEDYYHRLLAAQAQTVADAHRLDLSVFSADDTPGKQASDILRFASGDTEEERYVLVVPVSDARQGVSLEEGPFYRLARKVLAKGVHWITLNHGDPAATRALAREFPDRTVALMAIDNVEFGRVQGRQLEALVPQGGVVLYLVGNPDDTASQDRRQGLLEVLDPSRYQLEEVDGFWRAEVVERAVNRWVHSPLRRDGVLAAVISQDDEMALAARAVLGAAARTLGRRELADVPIFGGDGLPDRGARWVATGELAGTVCVTLPAAVAIEELTREWMTGVPMTQVTHLAPKAFPSLGRRLDAQAGAPDRTAPSAEGRRPSRPV
jgi:DNA-binding LacI/PurR family transcriptional regulator